MANIFDMLFGSGTGAIPPPIAPASGGGGPGMGGRLSPNKDDPGGNRSSYDMYNSTTPPYRPPNPYDEPFNAPVIWDLPTAAGATGGAPVDITVGQGGGPRTYNDWMNAAQRMPNINLRPPGTVERLPWPRERPGYAPQGAPAPARGGGPVTDGFMGAVANTFRGTSTGRLYNVGQHYTSGGYIKQAMPDGTFKTVGKDKNFQPKPRVDLQGRGASTVDRQQAARSAHNQMMYGGVGSSLSG